MKWLLLIPLMLFALPLLMLAPIIGMLVDPFAPWQFSGHLGQVADGQPVVAVPFDPSVIPVTNGGVTDAFRYQLARAAGWSHDDAITAVAVSIAEVGSGNPTALSPVNKDGSRDFCLLQINSGWWPRFGGQMALADPQTCFNAGHVVYELQGWCAWSTYESSCGRGHTGSYQAYLPRARAAALIQPLPGQA